MTMTMTNTADAVIHTDMGRGGNCRAAWLDPEGVFHPAYLHDGFETSGVRGYDHFRHGWVRVWVNLPQPGVKDSGEVGFQVSNHVQCNSNQLDAMRTMIAIADAALLTCSHHDRANAFHWNRDDNDPWTKPIMPLTPDLIENILTVAKENMVP